MLLYKWLFIHIRVLDNRFISDERSQEINFESQGNLI